MSGLMAPSVETVSENVSQWYYVLHHIERNEYMIHVGSSRDSLLASLPSDYVLLCRTQATLMLKLLETGVTDENTNLEDNELVDWFNKKWMYTELILHYSMDSADEDQADLRKRLESVKMDQGVSHALEVELSKSPLNPGLIENCSGRWKHLLRMTIEELHDEAVRVFGVAHEFVEKFEVSNDNEEKP